MANRKIAFFVIMFALTITALAAFGNLWAARAYKRWVIEFAQGTVTDAEGGAMLRWYDARNGGVMHFDDAIISDMRQSQDAMAKVTLAIQVLNDPANYGRYPADRETSLLEKASLAALAGDRLKAKQLADSYCGSHRPPRGDLSKCLTYALEFFSQGMGPQEAIYVYSTAKLASSVGAVDPGVASHYEAISVMRFDAGSAKDTN